MKCMIVGSGPSLNHISYDEVLRACDEDTTLIGVNGGADWLEWKCDYFFTIDLSEINIKRIKESPWYVHKIVASPLVKWPEFTEVRNMKQLVRVHNNVGANTNDYQSPEWWLYRFGCVTGFQEEKNKVSTGNSVYSCLNYVYNNIPNLSKVLMLGLDGTQEHKVTGEGKPNNLSHLNLLFESCKKQLTSKNIEVKIGNERSNITCLDRIHIREGLKWIKE